VRAGHGGPEVSVTRRGAPLAAIGLGWVLIYALIAAGPLVIALTADPPEGRSFLTELSVVAPEQVESERFDLI